jgi:hypothetical protein
MPSLARGTVTLRIRKVASLLEPGIDRTAQPAPSDDGAKSNRLCGARRRGAGPYTLTDNYKVKALSAAKQRIALAGARLAALLNVAVAR